MIEVKDLNDEKLKVYTSLNDNGLKHYYEPKEGLFIAESLKVIERALKAGYKPESFLIEKEAAEGEAKALIKKYDKKTDIYVMPQDEIKSITGYALTGGIFAAMKRKKLLSVADLLKDAKCIAILDNIENPTNVGAIFRNAAALSLDGVILTSASADPLYKRSSRVSMGTVFQIPWTICDEVPFKELQENGFIALAMALSNETISIDDTRLKMVSKSAIILGNEGDGLPEETIKKANCVVKIPMQDGVDSLNVAAASAIAFWELKKNSENISNS
jgi:tRNA G18 (ribose-2'-O)-methylase SpoU